MKDPYIVSCETTTSGPVSNYRRGVDSAVRFSRRDKGGRGRGAPHSSERKVRIRGVGESHTGHRTGTIFFRCPPPFSILKTDSWPEVTHRPRRDRRSRERNFGQPFLNERIMNTFPPRYVIKFVSSNVKLYKGRVFV